MRLPLTRLSPFWKTVAHFQADKISPLLALRNTLGVAIPLALGVSLGQIPAGVTAAIGAMNVSYSDGQDPYSQRARRMLLWSAVAGFGVFAGAVLGQRPPIAVALACAWAFAAGMLVAVSGTAADLGVISLVTLVVYAAAPQSFEHAVRSGLLATGGGLLQTFLAILFWPVRPHIAERRALAGLFTELARAARAPLSATEAPPASAQSTAAQKALAGVGRGHSLEAERYRHLLSQAERMRLSLLTLRRLRIRLGREDPQPSEGAVLDRCIELCAEILTAIGRALQSNTPVASSAHGIQELQEFSERLRGLDLAVSPRVSAMVRDARIHLDALAGQLRSALDLTAASTSTGRAALERREKRMPWTLRVAGSLATMRANLTFRSAACRHAVRLAVCVALGDALARGFHLPRSYWLPMTVAIVLKPDFTATFSRGVLRLAGTFLGLAFATILFHVIPAGLSLEVLLVAACMFLLRCFGPANYGLFVTALTALVVLLFAMSGVSPKDVIAARGLNTALGGAIALVAYAAWPTWERTQVPEALARMLDAYRTYFRAVREAYLRPEDFHDHELDSARLGGRLARSNLEASVDRLCAEPGTSPERSNILSGILAASHRLAHAMMALEAGLTGSNPVPAREGFRPFADQVEVTLYLLAAALRGSPVRKQSLPPLRELHHALVHSAGAVNDRYALVNVETDRITNSLNTVADHVFQWIGNVEQVRRA